MTRLIKGVANLFTNRLTEVAFAGALIVAVLFGGFAVVQTVRIEGVQVHVLRWQIGYEGFRHKVATLEVKLASAIMGKERAEATAKVFMDSFLDLKTQRERELASYQASAAAMDAASQMAVKKAVSAAKTIERITYEPAPAVPVLRGLIGPDELRVIYGQEPLSPAERDVAAASAAGLSPGSGPTPDAGTIGRGDGGGAPVADGAGTAGAGGPPRDPG